MTIVTTIICQSFRNITFPVCVAPHFATYRGYQPAPPSLLGPLSSSGRPAAPPPHLSLSLCVCPPAPGRPDPSVLRRCGQRRRPPLTPLPTRPPSPTGRAAGAAGRWRRPLRVGVDSGEERQGRQQGNMSSHWRPSGFRQEMGREVNGEVFLCVAQRGRYWCRELDLPLKT